MDKKQKYFDSLAEDWDKDLTAEDLERLSHLLDRFDIGEGVKVCDLGCGTGVMFDMLRRRVGQSGYIVGVDFAPQVAHRAQQNFPFHNIGVVEAEASGLPFAPGTFDLVISFAAFAHFANKEGTICEAHRVLKPKGRMFVIHLLGSAELASYHHHIGGPVDHDILPDRNHLVNMFKECRFGRVDITDRKDLFLAIGSKE